MVDRPGGEGKGGEGRGRAGREGRGWGAGRAGSGGTEGRDGMGTGEECGTGRGQEMGVRGWGRRRRPLAGERQPPIGGPAGPVGGPPPGAGRLGQSEPHLLVRAVMSDTPGGCSGGASNAISRGLLRGNSEPAPADHIKNTPPTVRGQGSLIRTLDAARPVFSRSRPHKWTSVQPQAVQMSKGRMTGPTRREHLGRIGREAPAPRRR